ncbi:hypothetical protein [Sphingobacterium arenae]|uniref:Uncharacterized protein n=1 Tax=Sphingobacterium arenae TaxID=1280598 RepID=A0ABR7Y5Z2_9SPHI|nr:hypothetical protein [Sphingobacterium arenae]MBD1426714.1 hypothetical protein [Sphingobacterium arenae]
MTDLSIPDLYKFYRDQLSYQALINGGGYKKHRNRILCVLILPLIIVFVFGLRTYNYPILGSERMINMIIFIGLYIIYLIGIQYYFKFIDKKKGKWLNSQKNPEQLPFPEFVYKHRHLALKEYLMKHGVSTPEQWQHTIEELEKHRKKSLEEILFLMALIGGALGLLNDDIRNLLVGNIGDAPLQSWMYILFVSALIIPVYKLLLLFRNQDTGKWPIYKQMVNILKTTQPPSSPMPSKDTPG